eukprot:7122153-Prymnesium_polylepis.1
MLRLWSSVPLTVDNRDMMKTPGSFWHTPVGVPPPPAPRCSPLLAAYSWLRALRISQLCRGFLRFHGQLASPCRGFL